MSDRIEESQREGEDGVGVGGGAGEEEEDGADTPRIDDEQWQPQSQQQRQKQRRRGRWCKRKIRNAKHLILSPFQNIKRVCAGRGRRIPSLSSSPSSHHYYYGDDPGNRCYLCFRPPPAGSGSPPQANPSNANNPHPKPSSYEFVKSLIESNDFYAPECNAHRDVRCPHRDGD